MINRLSYSRLGNISFIARETISYFVPRSLRSLVTKYDIVSRAIKLISPRLSYDNLYIYTLVYPYCHTVWSDNRIFLLQNQIVRILTNSKTRAPTALLLSEFKILDIYNLNSFYMPKFMFHITITRSFYNLFVTSLVKLMLNLQFTVLRHGY